ncbi:SapC family protein, partial [Acinetobacter baumannii]
RALLVRMADDMEAATRFVVTLAAERLVTRITITLHFADQHQQDITGAYTIDPLALDALDDAAVLRLHRSGLLAPIHAMI